MKTRRIANNDYPGYEVYRSPRAVFNEPCYTLVAAAHCRSSSNGFVESYSRWPPISNGGDGATRRNRSRIAYSRLGPAKPSRTWGFNLRETETPDSLLISFEVVIKDDYQRRLYILYASMA